jgi:hypothetical protein
MGIGVPGSRVCPPTPVRWATPLEPVGAKGDSAVGRVELRLLVKERNKLSVRKHLLGSNLAKLRLVEMTPGAIEQFLQAKGDNLAPQTVNHLRAFVMSGFSAAKKAGKFSGPNPVREVARRKVPRRAPAVPAGT